MKIEISLDGCDDSTTITCEITENEFEFLKVIAKEFRIVSSGVICKPTMNYKLIQ